MSMLDIFDIGPNKRVGISINERDLAVHDLLRQYSNVESESDNVCAFKLNGTNVRIGLLGCGDINIQDSFGANINIDLTDGEYFETELKFDEQNNKRFIFIYDLDKITELHIYDDNAMTVEDIEFTPNNTVNKLVIIDAAVTSLDVSNLKGLRVLHIPGCAMTRYTGYENNVAKLVESLPERVDKRHGSIVLYKYIGLEVLLFNDYTKYPTGESVTGSDTKLYGVIQCDKATWDSLTTRQRINTPIKYRYYNRNGFYASSYTEQLELGNAIRIQNEPKLFAKNWFVGSAIEYHKDWELCYWPFRKLGIHEIWESAQKGFGITYATIDSFSNKRLPLWEDFNGHGLFSMFNSDEQPLTAYEGVATDYHGDALHQYVAGRAQRVEDKYNLNMGLAPNVASYFFSYKSMTDGSRADMRTIKFITEHCDLYSSSYSGYNTWPNTAYSETNSTPEWIINYQFYRKYLNEWAESNFACVSAGNSGDDNPGTLDDTQRRGKNIRMGYYSKGLTDDEIKSLILTNDNPFGRSSNNVTRSKCFSVNSMMQNDISDPYSTTAALSMWESNQLYSDYTDALSMYGCQTPQYYSVNDCWYSATGTSNASPACAMVVGCLMRILYTKMFPNYSETAIYDVNSSGSINSYKYVDGGFGKGTKFMDYVNSHWMNKLPDQMTYQVGLGMPTFNCEPEPRNIKYIYTVEGFGSKRSDGYLPFVPPVSDEDRLPINLLDAIDLSMPAQEMGIASETRKPPNVLVPAVTEMNYGQYLKSQSTLDVCQQTYAKKKDGSIVLINTDKLKQGDDFVTSPSSIVRPLVKKPYIYWNSNSPAKHKGTDQFVQTSVDLTTMENYMYKYAEDLFTQTINSPIHSKIVIGNELNELFYGAIENEDGANINSLDWTIQIPFSVELLFKDVLANKATIDRYDTVFPFVQFSDDSEQGMLFSAHRFKINWDAETNRYWIGQSSRPFALQPKSFTKFVTSDNGLVDLSNSVYSTYTNTNMSGHNLEFEETCVITFVQKSKYKCIEIYYNGTYMSTFYLFDVDKLFRLTDAVFVKPNVIGHPLVYDHNLTEDEIIYNTAYLKQFRSNIEY